MSETTRTITKSSECRNIEFLLRFMDGITVDRLFTLSLDDAERLCRLFKASSREGCGADAFTRLDVALCTDAKGKNLPYTIGGKTIENFSGSAVAYSEGQYNHLYAYLIPEYMAKLRKLFEGHAFAHKCKSASEETQKILKNVYKAICNFSGA